MTLWIGKRVDQSVLDFLERLNINDFESKVLEMVEQAAEAQDAFWEIIVDPQNPSAGIYAFQTLPPSYMWRIETQKKVLLEFQQATEHPDYEAVLLSLEGKDPPISKALRFSPAKIIHLCPDNYGVARGKKASVRFSDKHVRYGFKQLIVRHLEMIGAPLKPFDEPGFELRNIGA